MVDSFQLVGSLPVNNHVVEGHTEVHPVGVGSQAGQTRVSLVEDRKVNHAVGQSQVILEGVGMRVVPHRKGAEEQVVAPIATDISKVLHHNLDQHSTDLLIVVAWRGTISRMLRRWWSSGRTIVLLILRRTRQY